jgi:glycosyltransferase involved in cell wall biosynthesis
MNELDSLYFSLIIPVFNELNNLDILYNNIITSLSAYDDKYEIIFIDDGSNDGSYEKLSGFALEDVKVKLIKFRRNFGQTAAISAGISHSSGKIIIFIEYTPCQYVSCQGANNIF